jgi:hypothetical protein
MLAYVFWHWRRGDVPAARYETLQRAFHAALRDAPSPGFLGSRSLALTGAPWAGGGGEAYEDWYLVEDSAALDPLNTAAVSASRQAAHDAAAVVAAGGTAGLYGLRSGRTVEAPGVATWFAKPDGTSYATLFAVFEPLVRRSGGGLWCRHMVLGPTPEFCLHAPEPVALPDRFVGLTLSYRTVWPERRAHPDSAPDRRPD